MDSAKPTIADRFKAAAIRTAIKGVFNVLPIEDIREKVLQQIDALIYYVHGNWQKDQLAEDEFKTALLVDITEMPDGTKKMWVHEVRVMKDRPADDQLAIRKVTSHSLNAKVNEYAKLDLNETELVDGLVASFTGQPVAQKLPTQPETPQLPLNTDNG